MAVVLVHGGVTGIARASRPSLRRVPFTPSPGGASALDLVEAAVRALEDDPSLNAGFGSVLNQQGEIELDAGIADGSTGRWAGVAGVRVRHPVSLARRVLETTPHVLMAGAGAMAVAPDLEVLAATSARQRRRWLAARRAGELGVEGFGDPEHVDTVGAVALDEAGYVAAASSTGGVFGKLPGRVGDAPIFGAGLFVSPRVAVVGTGVGELFLQTLAAARVGSLVEEGLDPQAACRAAIDHLGTVAAAPAGLLAVDVEGRAGAAFRGASWAVEGAGGPLEPVRLP
ncbi:MAG: isoaspartyl peptidase/L-asparaginase [Actinomycetota bacterium]